MLSILNAKYENEYKILLEFSDHKKGKVDYTLKWSDDLDLDPEYLYFKAFENDSSLQEKFHDWGYV